MLEKVGVECMFGEGSFVGEKEVFVKCEGGCER